MFLVKKLLINAISAFGYSIRGFHPILILESDKPYIIELIGMGGKTYLYNKYSNAYKISKIKPTIDSDSSGSNQTFYSETIFLMKLLVRGLEEKRITTYRFWEAMFKLLISDKYLQKGTQLWDEGLIKGSFSFFSEVALNEPKALKKCLSQFAFVIIKPEIEITYSRYLKRYRNRLRFLSKEKKAEVFNRIYTNYQNLEVFENFLLINSIPYILLTTNEKNTVEILNDFIMKTNKTNYYNAL